MTYKMSALSFPPEPFYRTKLQGFLAPDFLCPAKLTIFIESMKLCFLEDIGDQLLHQQVTNLGIHNDAIVIQSSHSTFDEKKCKTASNSDLENLFLYLSLRKLIVKGS